MPPHDDVDTTAARFREIAGTAEIRTPARLLPRIIGCRDTIADLRRRGAEWSRIASLLGEVGIQISPGTLRNYTLRIDRAVACLAAEAPDTAPSLQEIDALCLRQARAGAPQSPRATHVTPPASPRPQHRPPRPGPTTPWPTGQLIRDDDLKL